MYLNVVVFSFDILNTNRKFSIILEQNSLEPAHVKSSTCTTNIPKNLLFCIHM